MPVYPLTIVKRRGSLSDVLLTTPILRELRIGHPRSRLVVETSHPELFERNPDVDLAEYPMRPSWPDVNKASFVIDLDTAPKPPGVPVLDAYADVAGVTLSDRSLVYNCSGEALEWASREVHAKATKRVVGIHMGPSLEWEKNWPTVHWIELSVSLISQGFEVMLVGGFGSDVILHVPNQFDIRERASIDQTAAALFGCCLFVGIDSFPLYLAMSQGVPVVGIFAKANPSGAAGPAIICEGDPSVEQVLDAVASLKASTMDPVEAD